MKKGIVIILLSLLLVSGASEVSYAADEDFPRVLHNGSTSYIYPS